MMRYGLLISFYLLVFVRGAKAAQSPHEAVAARTVCLVSNATMLGLCVAAPFITDDLMKKHVITAGGLAVCGVIAGYWRLSRLLPAHARSLKSISCYLITGIWPGQSRGISPQQCDCQNVRVSSVSNFWAYIDSSGTYVNGVRMHHSHCHLSRNENSSSPQDTTMAERTLSCDEQIHTLVASTFLPITVKKGSSNSVTIRAPRHVLEQLKEGYDGGVLTLATTARACIVGNRTGMIYQVEVTNPERLHTIRQRGIGNLTLPAIGANEVDTEIEASGNGNLTVHGDIVGKNVSLRQTSIGNCTIDGSIQAFAGECTLQAEGNGNMACRNVTSKNALKIALSSIGSITLNNAISRFSTLNITLKGTGNFTAEQCSANTVNLTKTSIGAARITESIVCQKLVIEQSGIGNTTCKGVQTNTVEINNSGIGSITLSGTCAKGGTVVNTGVGNCDLRQLTAKIALWVRSNGRVRVNTW